LAVGGEWVLGGKRRKKKTPIYKEETLMRRRQKGGKYKRNKIGPRLGGFFGFFGGGGGGKGEQVKPEKKKPMNFPWKRKKCRHWGKKKEKSETSWVQGR